jgi:hypothetical protein
MADFDYAHLGYLQSKPTCPHCGYEEMDAWDIDFGGDPEGDTIQTCGRCEEEYSLYRIIDVSYHSEKITP